MKIGIVGHEARKFTPELARLAKERIRDILLCSPGGCDICISGACHLGGVDIWATEIARNLGIPTLEFPSTSQTWGGEGGFKARNIRIAEASDKVYVIVCKELPLGYGGMKFDKCYHCNRTSHVKSGACWTANYARKVGKEAEWIEI